jgi:natural product biosynthesis luciferase-like monooxygenase protein
MKFGISFFPDSKPEQKSGQQYFEEALNLTEQADGLGFDHVRIVEHYEHAYGGYSSNPSIFLAAASQRAKNLRLVTGCVLPAFTHPVKMAHELSMLDSITGGRLDVGFARAFLPHEFETFNVSMSESNQRYRENIEVIRRLWTEEDVTHEGEIFQFKNVNVMPRITQNPHPSMWVAAIQTPESFVWAGQQGMNLMAVPYLADYEKLKENIKLYKDSYREAGHGEAQPEQIALGLHAFVYEDDDTEGLAKAEKYMAHYVDIFLESATAWDSTESQQYKGYDKIAETLRAMTFDRVMKENRAAIGTAEEVTASCKQLAEYLGIGTFSLQLNFGSMDYEDARKSVELFGTKVIPQLVPQNV